MEVGDLGVGDGGGEGGVGVGGRRVSVQGGEPDAVETVHE